MNPSNLTKENEEIVMICIKSRIRLVGIGETPRRIRNIEFPSCLVSARRSGFACVADAHSYALLDVENQQKILLFPISSQEETLAIGEVQDLSERAAPTMTRSSSTAHLGPAERIGDKKSHNRSTSLGALVTGGGRQQESSQSRSQERLRADIPEITTRAPSPSQDIHFQESVSASGSPGKRPSTPEKALPAPPEDKPQQKSLPPLPAQLISNLKPNITSPTPTEFLLTTGTAPTDPGVGIFVNLDGDVVRGTLEFERYPVDVVVDGHGTEVDFLSENAEADNKGYVLASMKRSRATGDQSVIEIQRWDADVGESKEWLEIPTLSSSEEKGNSDDKFNFGLRAVHTSVPVPFPEIGKKLRATRLRLPDTQAWDPDLAIRRASGRNYDISDNSATERPMLKESISFSNEKPERNIEHWESVRNKEEEEFGRRLGGRASRITVWSGSSIWWVVRNPLAIRLDDAIDGFFKSSTYEGSHIDLKRSKIIQIVNSIRGQEARTETEFLSLGYIRQKTSLILFADVVIRKSPLSGSDADRRITEGLLIEGGLDPRVVLTMIPFLCEEIVEGPRGIWIHAGLIWIIERYWSLISLRIKAEQLSHDLKTTEILGVVKRYLISWRQRKGFGSIADEVEVFQTVDAAVLHILLHQHRQSSSTPPISSSMRAELYSVVDNSIDCFDRAVTLLEQYRRLYVLSRLYQSRKMAREVLQTWARIIEGETDEGGELADGENEVRKYLVRLKDATLVNEYGTWLARRNPALGVQVFTDDNSRIKLEPSRVVHLLQDQAPDAVKVYLEHLVFGKKNVQYANHLISYYLDSVLTVLKSSEDARAILAQSYRSYRALGPPKPTYRQFIVENAIPSSWWHDRLRLLELLGGSHGADFSYDVSSILSRIEPFEQDLVPESIILDGRQGRHERALHLLTQGLGDYHTAINYCLLGGASIFHPISGLLSPDSIPSQEEQAALFKYLLSEFLQIEDVNDRLERTSELLERFGSWFDVRKVLDLIPDSWSVELVSGFLVSAFRRVIQERNEAMITKALSGAENLQIASIFVEKCRDLGPNVETVQ